MGKKVIVTYTDYSANLDSDVKDIEYPGDTDAQLHNNGCLVIVEYVPDLLAAEKGAKKAELIAMYNKSCWDSVRVE